MVTVAVIRTPNADAPDTVARRIFEELPEVEIELVRFVPLADRAVPYFWVWGDDVDEFESILGGYRNVSAVEQLETVEGGALYRIEWNIDSPMIHCVNQSNATLLEANGTADRWKLTVWLKSGADASELLRCCKARGVPIEVGELRSVAEETVSDQGVVTARQREVLTTAYENGYFERPREITQTQLAQMLGVSASAAGDRLRRGIANIVESRLIE